MFNSAIRLSAGALSVTIPGAREAGKRDRRGVPFRMDTQQMNRQQTAFARNRSALQRDLREHCAQPNRQWLERQHKRLDPGLCRTARNHGTTNTRPDRNRIHRNQPPAARAAHAMKQNRCREPRNASCRPNRPHWSPSRAGRGTAGVVEPHCRPRANTVRA